MKKILILLLCAMFMVISFAGCKSGNSENSTEKTNTNFVGSAIDEEGVGESRDVGAVTTKNGETGLTELTTDGNVENSELVSEGEGITTTDINNIDISREETTDGIQTEDTITGDMEENSGSQFPKETTLQKVTTIQKETEPQQETTPQKEMPSPKETTSQRETIPPKETTLPKETTAQRETIAQKETTSQKETPPSKETEPWQDLNIPIEVMVNSEDMFSQRDCLGDYNTGDAISIQLKGNTAVASSDSVKISGSKITITKEAVYVVSGTLYDGMLIVDGFDTDKIQIVLKEANITSKTSAALYIKEADKVFVTLTGDNKLSSGNQYSAIDENNIDSAVFSKQDITFNGTGSLTISAPAGHGIVGKDDVIIAGGKYNITSASHGIDANDSVRIREASITLDTGKDGIHVENNTDYTRGYIYVLSGSFGMECAGDGISASAYIQIDNGTMNIRTGGGAESGSSKGSSLKGIKADAQVVIKNGIFTIDSAEDAIHSGSSVVIKGGKIKILGDKNRIHGEKAVSVSKAAEIK